MTHVDLEKPFRLSREFWVAYALLGIPVLWIVQPWGWNLPFYSLIAGVVFLPFAAAIVCYCPFLFVSMVVLGSSKERRIGWMFAASVVSASLFLLAIKGLFGFESLPSQFGAVAVVLANLVFALLHAKFPHQH